jgi:hypothetical protein
MPHVIRTPIFLFLIVFVLFVGHWIGAN